MFFKIIFLGLLIFVDKTHGSCGICQTNFIACHSETTFSLCLEGIPTDSIVSCPVGSVCTHGSRVCVPKIDDSVRPSCVTGCKTCASYRNVFSCLSKTEFAFCFGEAEPFSSSKGTCLDGYVCELSSRTICVPATSSEPSCDIDPFMPTDNTITTSDPTDSTTTTSSSSTSSSSTSSSSTSSSSTSSSSASSSSTSSSSTSEDPTPTEEVSSSTTEETLDTTTHPPRDASVFCSETMVAGYFKAEGDTTCTKYFFCVEYSGIFYGTENVCPNSKFFHSISQQCVQDRPSNC